MPDEGLRRSLANVNSTAVAIQAAAAALMKHYDTSAVNAVNEWRNAVYQSKGQLLALLYVANEVLQTSKRNRGNKFLEAFAPILPNTMVFFADHGVPVEKLRRVTEIWGERRVFSLRFTNEVLDKLERFRQSAPSQRRPDPGRSPRNKSKEAKRPAASISTNSATKVPKASPPAPKPNPKPASESSDDDNSNESIQDILDAHGRSDDDKDDDDDDDLFGGNDDSAKLDVEINLDSVVSSAASLPSPSKDRPRSAKRRRSGGAARRTGDRSISKLLDLWKSLVDNQQRYELATHALDRVAKQSKKAEDASMLVGDTLRRAAIQTHADLSTLYTQRTELFNLANERRSIEQQALSYLSWLEQAVEADKEELRSADYLLEQLSSYHQVHIALQKQYRADKAAAKAEAEAAEAAERARQQREAQQAFKDAALAKETEAKPGMVWNPTTREYQTLDTEESWRD